MGKFKRPSGTTQTGNPRIPSKVLEDPAHGAAPANPSNKRQLIQAVDAFESDPAGAAAGLLLSRIKGIGLGAEVAALRGIVERVKAADATGSAQQTLQALEERIERLDSEILDAAFQGDLEAADALLGIGADALARDAVGRTTLMWACKGNHVPMAVRMKELGVDVNAEDNNRWTALMYCASNDSYEAADFLLDNNATIDAENTDRQTAARIAYDAKHNRTYELLIRGGATDPRSNVVDLDKYRKKDLDTKFLAAAEKGDTEEALRLLSDGADVNATGRWNYTGLMFALEYERFETADALVEKDIEVDAKNDFGITAFMLALDNHNPKAANRLIDKKADVCTPDHKGRTPLMRAGFWGLTGLARRILDKDADVDALDEGGSSALFDAVSRNKLKTAELLLERKADPNRENDEGQTPLKLAKENDNPDMIALLKRYGAREEKPRFYKTPQFIKRTVIALSLTALAGLGYVAVKKCGPTIEEARNFLIGNNADDLISDLFSKDWEVRWKVSGILQRMDMSRAQEDLIIDNILQAYSKKIVDWDDQLEARPAILAIGPKTAFERIASIVESDSKYESRLCAIKALPAVFYDHHAVIDLSRSIEMLSAIFQDHYIDIKLRAEAARTMGTIVDRNPESMKRSDAINALSRSLEIYLDGSREKEPLIITLAAVHGLGRIGDASSIKLLGRILRYNNAFDFSGSLKLQREAIIALARISKKTKERNAFDNVIPDLEFFSRHPVLGRTATEALAVISSP